MESAVKHEVLHILSLHPLRAKDLKKRFSPLAVDLAMDIVVNTYLAPPTVRCRHLGGRQLAVRSLYALIRISRILCGRDSVCPE